MVISKTAYCFAGVLDFMTVQYIRKTCLCNVYPLEPHLYSKMGYVGVYLFFLFFAPKHRLWVLVRTASARRF